MSNENLKQLLNFSLINIDKPSGPTSFQVSQFVKTSLSLDKASHMGTLDPQVTGVLPVTLGRACKLSEIFMHRNKTYVGIMRLHSSIEKKKLEKALAPFLGEITQLPPVRSRVKRAERQREIHSFKILEIDGKDVLFETEVQAGTYIRKLIHDLGEKLEGAHMLELRRTQAGIFDESKIYTLYEFESAVSEYKSGKQEDLLKMLIPAEEAIKQVLPVVQINEKNVEQLLVGKPLMKSDLSVPLPDQETFALFNKERFIGIYKQVKEEGDIIAKAMFVYN
ncbi:RNA-guided pseudouridylation complex pseudouridine synthase subunit Cbf5 [Candidatus Pacearchaeota archaeon]|nr:RNA-guided pseudouridylation complex pseudouridine synthase subunit Cbf5 [Candidatus Pacearchaeota archaeon]